MAELIVHRATPDDCDAVAELFDRYRQFYKQPPNLALAKAFINARLANGDSVILLATEAEGRIIGFCQLYPTFCSVLAAPTYTLYDLFVHPTSRNSGAGARLLAAAEQQAKKDGMARLDLSTARSNLPAQSLYEAQGWLCDEEFFHYSKSVS